jgi:hypothetical protein
MSFMNELLTALLRIHVEDREARSFKEGVLLSPYGTTIAEPSTVLWSRGDRCSRIGRPSTIKLFDGIC